MVRWTRQEIIRSILQREAAGLPLSLGGEAPVGQSLYQAASRVFGTWRKRSWRPVFHRRKHSLANHGGRLAFLPKSVPSRDGAVPCVRMS